jgi:hypothetical protein
MVVVESPGFPISGARLEPRRILTTVGARVNRPRRSRNAETNARDRVAV